MKGFTLLLLLVLIFPLSGSAQLFTRRAGWMNEDRFNIRFLFSQYGAARDTRLIREFMINPQIGLHPRVEFVGWVPLLHVQDPNLPDQSMGTLGDIQGDLNFELKKFWYRLPFVQEKKDTLSFLNLYLGFNFATGPGEEFAEGFFFPYAVGVGDFRWGLLWGSYTRKWEYFLNFIYTYAFRKGETIFPVADKPFDFPADKSQWVVLWNLHRILLKFLWPGPAYGEWPMRDDFILYSFNFSYWLEGFPVLLKHKLMCELNGIQNFDAGWSMRPSQLDLTLAVMTRFHRGAKTFLGGSLPLVKGLYTGPKFTVGVMFSL